jgi:glycosyltransferase involved in cell wall biosynthesis
VTGFRGAIVIASGPTITHHTAESLAARPLQDFTALQDDHDTIIVDPAVAVRGRIAELVARTLGTAWVVAYAALKAAGSSRVVITGGDDIAVPMSVIKHIRFRKVPVVCICQHMRTKKAKLLFGKLRTHRRIELFFASSAAQRDMMVRDYGVPPGKIEIGYDHTDADFWRQDDTEERRQLASAGTSERDYATLIRATQGLDADVRIEASSAWYAGEPNHEHVQLHERVELTSSGTTKGLRAIYASSQIVVVPLIEADHPAGYNTIMEGMSMGKPVIASRIHYVGDFIDDGRTGFLVPPHDPDALRATIDRLLADPELRHRIGAAARQEVLDRFSIEHFRERMRGAVQRFQHT